MCSPSTASGIHGSRWQVGCVIAVSVIAVSILVVVSVSLHLQAEGVWPNTSIAEISEMTGINFPASARLVRSINATFVDTMLDAKIILYTDDVGLLVKSIKSLSHKPGTIVEISRRYKLGADRKRDISWWNPSANKKFIAASVKSCAGRRRTTIFIRLDDHHQAVAYLSLTHE